MKVTILSQLVSTGGVLFLLVLLAACDTSAIAAPPAVAPFAILAKFL